MFKNFIGQRNGLILSSLVVVGVIFPLIMSGCGGSGSVTLPTLNMPPKADAGADKTVDVGSVVTLDGSASSDPDGDTLTYHWEQTYGPTVTLNNPNSMVATFTAKEEGTYKFSLTVNDGNGGSDSATIQITAKTKQYTLKVNTDGHGSVSLDPLGGRYDDGTQVKLIATPDRGWQFDHWEGDLSGIDNPTTITMDSDKTVTAVFTEIPPTQYTLTVNKKGQGDVALDPDGKVYDDGTQVTLTAIPADGWEFDHWEGDLSGSDNPTMVTVNSDKIIMAVFKDIQSEQHKLTVTVDGQGSVAFDPDSGTYDDGTQVTLTATPADGLEFDHWEGDLSGSDNPAMITMDSDKIIKAVFKETETNQYTLKVNTDGHGSVSLDPAGGTYDDGTQVTLTATPADGWQFDHWEGDITGNSNPAILIINGEKNIKAIFTQIPANSVLFQGAISGNGNVSINPVGTPFGFNTWIYSTGSTITLTATEQLGWMFDGWYTANSNLISNQKVIQLTLTSDTFIIAKFVNLTPPPAPTYLGDFVYSADGQFLGIISTNQFDPDSLANPFGTYGNEYNMYSIWNPYGLYGSEYGLYSPYNPYTITPPYVYNIYGVFIGYLTKNPTLYPAFDPDDVAIILGRYDVVRY